MKATSGILVPTPACVVHMGQSHQSFTLKIAQANHPMTLTAVDDLEQAM
jgi:hypothetical protein